MSADNTREVLSRWEKWDLVIDRNDFIVRLARPIAIPLDLLRPGDHQTEVGCFGQLCKLGCFRRRENFGFQACGSEVFGGVSCIRRINGADELRIATHLLKHPYVFAAHRTVRDSRAGSLCHCSCRSNSDRAVNNRQPWLVFLDVARSFTHEVFNLKWVADMQYIDLLHGLRGGLDVDSYSPIVSR